MDFLATPSMEVNKTALFTLFPIISLLEVYLKKHTSYKTQNCNRLNSIDTYITISCFEWQLFTL